MGAAKRLTTSRKGLPPTAQQRLAVLLRDAVLDAYIRLGHPAIAEVMGGVRVCHSLPGDGWLTLAEELMRRGVRPPEQPVELCKAPLCVTLKAPEGEEGT